MLDDFVLIKHKSDNPINLYPIGDVHIGSKEFDSRTFERWLDTVENDDNARVVIVGDMMNMGLKNSKSNVYEEVLHPFEQKEMCYEYLVPIKNKIIGAVSGNHEYRSVKEVGSNPLYDVMCRLGIEDIYRENIAFIKLTVGNCGKNPNVYGLTLTHGSTKSKDEKWNYSVDGCDLFITGHTHEASHKPFGKIKMDLTHETVKVIGYHHIVVTPFQAYGGYAIRGKYMPSNLGQFQCINFSSSEKRIGYTFN